MDCRKLAEIRAQLDQQRVSKIDIFDIDGTLFKGRLLLNLIYALCENIPERRCMLGLLQDNYDLWRFGSISTQELYAKITEMADKGFFEGLNRRRVLPIATAVANGCKDVVYPFTYNLLSLLKVRQDPHRGLLVAITGAPEEIAQTFCKGYEFDVVISVVYETDQHDRYTAQRDLDAGKDKGKILEMIGNMFKLSLRDSIGVGDTSADIAILDKVGYPIAINPDSKLLDHVRRSRRIPYLSDSGKKGIQIFKSNQDGAFEEVTIQAILPGYLADIFPRMPGMRR